MAIIKRRIMSRGRCVAIMSDRFSDGKSVYSSDERRNAEMDSFVYMLADDKTVKVYNDVNLGGLVVEYDDGR